MVVVAVNHLQDVVVSVVITAVSDVLPVAEPVANGGNGAGDWRNGPPLSPDSYHSPLHPGDDAIARAVGPEPVAHVATKVQVAAPKPATPVSDPQRTHYSLGRAMPRRTPVAGLTQDALRPRPGSATGKAGVGVVERRRSPRVLIPGSAAA